MALTTNLADCESIFIKNAENYPNSANIYDSLTEAFEKNGQIKQAAENYEKAYKIVEIDGEEQLAKTAKANFARISGKMK